MTSKKIRQAMRVLVSALLSVCFIGCTPIYLPSSIEYPSVLEASFSPTDNSIAISFFSEIQSGIFLIDDKGKATKWLVGSSKKRWNRYLSFSPDGNLIAFVSANHEDRGDIYIIDRQGANLRQLTSGPHHDQCPKFSHDGKRIFFLRHRVRDHFPVPSGSHSWKSDVFYVDLETGKVHQVTYEVFRRLEFLSVYPDGQHILVRIRSYYQTGDLLWKININNPKIKQPIIPNLKKYNPEPRYHYLNKYKILEIDQPVLSRDGRYLVFNWQNPLHRRDYDMPPNSYIGPQVFIADTKTLAAHRLSNSKQPVEPLDISTDNQKILMDYPDQMDFSTTGIYPSSNLWIVNRDGSGLRNLGLDFTAVMGKPPAAALDQP